MARCFTFFEVHEFSPNVYMDSLNDKTYFSMFKGCLLFIGVIE